MASPISRKEEVTSSWLVAALGMPGRKIVDVTTKNVPVRNGFLSDMFLIEARLEEDAALGKGRHLNLIAKVPPVDPMMRQVALGLGAFEREVEVYNVFGSARFKDVCRRAGDLTFPIPKSAFATKSDTGGTILMRYLASKCGYKVLTSPEGLATPTLKVALETLAQVHATGFLFLKDMAPEERREFLPSKVKWEILSNHVLGGCSAVARKFSRHPVSKVLLEVAGEFRSCLDLPRKHPSFEAICHGDLWHGNLIYNADESRAILIDWQLSERGNPAMDIVTLVTLSASSESLTTEAISSCLQSYWRSLTEVLEAAGSPVPVSFLRLETCVNEMWLYGVLVLMGSIKTFLEQGKISDRRLESVLNFVHERNLLQALALEE
ncbi:uncharacterized protein LOC143025965 [Oratosquilla oratoria]|uniref:uncharacterized protein LOC143025965 n=1 Tax=Oratosquilla oratoria TaxID=337810 RepID=UPI003F76B834